MNVSSRRRLAGVIGLVLAAALLPVALRLALVPWTGVPQPAVHDEFSYLLAADTFASGRLANPPHPLWEHFEAPHVLQRPTYASKYFPGQGLVLGLGQAAGGHPWAGVLLGMALALGATAWMLRGWLPWRWAVLGVGLFVVRYAPGHYWWNSYWGGGLPAAGGALFLGALGRLLRRPSPGMAVTGGLGLSLLLLTRPNEALWLAVPSAIIVGLHIRRARRGARARRGRDAARIEGGSGAAGGSSPRVWLRRALAPGALAIIPALIFLGFYNRAVTGSPLTLPYMAYERTSGAWPFFKWDRPRPLEARRHEPLAKLDQWWREHRQRAIQPRGILRQARLILDLPTQPSDLRAAGGHLTRSVFGVLLLLALPCSWRDRRMRIPLILAGAALVDLNQIIIYFEHYGAPWAGLRVLLIARAAERACAWRRWRRVPPTWVAGLAAGGVLLATAAQQAAEAGRPADAERRITVDRPAIVAELARHPGRHLVVVRYAADHDFHQHWVYNAAAIDAAPIVWAWELGPERDRALFEHFAGRSFWRLEPDPQPPRLTRLAP